MFGRDRLVKKSLHERFIVTLRGGESFDGLLVAADPKTVRLVNAFAIDGKNRVAVDGELFLPRDQVSYLQKPGA
jgi:small nuclear ribonucleoprotein (snRNP)-like protein